MKKIFNNVKQLKTTIIGLLMVVPALIYALKTGDWNEHVFELIIAGIVSIFLPDFFTKEERKTIKDNFKNNKIVPIILLLILPVVSTAQNDETVKTLYVKNIVPLSSLKNLNPDFASDTTVNFYFNWGGGDSLIMVNDTLLNEWIVELFDLDTLSSSPGGANTQLQFNDGGNFGGTTGFVFDGTNMIGSSGYFQHESLRLDGTVISNNGGSPSINIAPNAPNNGTVQFNTTINPLNNNSIDVGSSVRNWRTGYFGTDIEVRDTTLVDLIIEHSSGASSVGALNNVNVSDGSGGFNTTLLFLNGSTFQTSTGTTMLSLGTGASSINSPLRGTLLGYSLGSSSIPWESVYIGSDGNSGRLDGTFTSDVIFTFPDKTGTVAMLSDITGGTPGGSNTQLQFNDAGSFGGISGVTWNGTTLSLNPTGNVDIGPTGNVGIESLTFSGNVISSAVNRVRMVTDVEPSTSSNYNLGNEGLFWDTLFVDHILGDPVVTIENMTLNGNIITRNGAGNIRIEGVDFENGVISGTLASGVIVSDDLTPQATGTYDLGTNALLWDTLYADHIYEFDAGEWTPTFSNLSNLDGNPVVNNAFYTQQKNYITIQCNFDVDVTTAGAFSFEFTTPISNGTNFPNTLQASGSGLGGGTLPNDSRIYIDTQTATERLRAQGYSHTTATIDFVFTATYQLQ